jgi:hypothetical protein
LTLFIVGAPDRPFGFSDETHRSNREAAVIALILASAPESRHNETVNPSFSEGDYALLLRELEHLFGANEIERKLKRVDHAVKRANALVTAYYGAPPKISFWLGLRKARQALARRALVSIADDDVRRTLDLAATLHVLRGTLPEWKRAELKSQLLSENALEPVLLEIKTAFGPGPFRSQDHVDRAVAEVGTTDTGSTRSKGFI